MRITVLAAMLVVSMTGVVTGTGTARAQDSAQSAQGSPSQGLAPGSVLVVNGHTGEASMIHRNGKWYVEVEGLARVTGGTLGFQGSKVVLNLPAGAAPPVVVVKTPPPPENTGFSREFLAAGVEQMSVIREWRSALENAIRTHNPVEENWVSYYRRISQDRMALATAKASTESDRKGLTLLQNQMSMINQLSDRFLALRSTLTFVDTTALDNDPLDQRITACAQGMAAIAVPGGQFEDVPACH